MKTRSFLRIIIYLTVIAIAVISLTGFTDCPSDAEMNTTTVLFADQYAAPGTSQVLLVMNKRLLFFNSQKVYALEKIDSTWRQALEPMDAVVGRNGFASTGEKREGDGRTPSGRYRLETVFGYAKSANTKMPYRQALADDLWVDDPQAPDYNRWVKQNQTRALSYEKMRRNDDLYKYGIVIEYNTNPIIKGYGSAIFFHVWAGAQSTTAGCVAVSEKDIRKIISWLNPAANPVIIINPDPI